MAQVRKPPSRKWLYTSLSFNSIFWIAASIFRATEFKANVIFCSILGCITLIWVFVEVFYLSPKRWKIFRKLKREEENKRWKENFHRREALYNKKRRIVPPPWPRPKARFWTTEELKDPSKVDRLK